MPSNDDSWYYAKGQEKIGPVSGPVIRNLVASGDLTRDALVWNPSLGEWSPFSEVQESIPGEATVSTAQLRGPVGGQGKEKLPIPADLKRASFTRLMVLGAICTVILGALAAYMYFGFRTAAAPGPPGVPATATITTLMTVMMVGLFAFLGVYIAMVVVGMIYLHRAWRMLQPFGASVTPGQAVGFQFIPIFNLYWFFRAYRDWARDYNFVLHGDERFTIAPPAREGVFLTFCIANVVAFPLDLIGDLGEIPGFSLVAGVCSLTALVCGVFMFYQICSAVNFFVDLREREDTHGVIPLRSSGYGGQVG